MRVSMTTLFWQCSCPNSNIHAKIENYCPVCKSIKNSTPVEKELVKTVLTSVRTNQIMENMRVRLTNGFEAEVKDSRPGNTRRMKIYAKSPYLGIVYTHDIDKVLLFDIWTPVELTSEQKHLRKIQKGD